jgi:hypothetical protein
MATISEWFTSVYVEEHETLGSLIGTHCVIPHPSINHLTRVCLGYLIYIKDLAKGFDPNTLAFTISYLMFCKTLLIHENFSGSSAYQCMLQEALHLSEHVPIAVFPEVVDPIKALSK